MCNDKRFKPLWVVLIAVLWVLPCVVIFSTFWVGYALVNRNCAYPNSPYCGWSCVADPTYSNSTSTLCSWCNTASFPNTQNCVRDTTHGEFLPAGTSCSLPSSGNYSNPCSSCVYNFGAVPTTVCSAQFEYNMLQTLSDDGLLATATVFTVVAALGIILIGVVAAFCCRRYRYGAPKGLVVVADGEAGSQYRPALGAGAV